MQLLLTYMCKDAGSRDASDGNCNTVLHHACAPRPPEGTDITSKQHTQKDNDGHTKSSGGDCVSQAYLVHWLMLKGVSRDVTNKDGKLPHELLQKGSQAWKYLQKTKHTGKLI